MDQISTPTSYSGSYLHSLSFVAYYIFCEYDMHGPGLCRLPALCLIIIALGGASGPLKDPRLRRREGLVGGETCQPPS